MKRKLHIALFIAGAGLALSSCESLLDQNPAEYVSDKAIITDLSSAKAALNGAYHQLGATNYYGGTIFVAAINLSGDNVTWTGSLNYYYDYNTHRYSAENQLLSNSWSGIYAAVNQANQVIDKTLVLDNISDEEKARITGEATVIRSLAFFDLARTWGSVPLVREATSSPTQFDGVKQTKEQDVYKEVIEDILSVYDGLSESSDRVHISKATADALLARVYLYSEEWEKAELHAAKLIDNGSYELIDYPVFFQEKQSRESIWELAYSSSNQNVHNHYWLAPDNGGRHEWGPSKELVSLLSDPLKGGTRKALYNDLSTAQVPDYYEGTVYHRTTGDDPAYLFRISEQYLIRAEARIKKSSPDIEGALADLNAVRERAEIPALSSTAVTDIIQAIEDENRLEFALEPHRWFDLKRTGRAAKVLGIEEYRTLFPIPYIDIQADKDLVQNPGY